MSILHKSFPSIFNPTWVGSHMVPGIWSSFFPNEFFDLEFPEETKSTCSQCPEVCDSGFRPDYRCCTFQPRVANFMLGLTMLSSKQEANHVIHDLLSRKYLTPEGLIASPARWKLFLKDERDKNFGKSDDVLCDFLDLSTGLCGIYNFRNGPCSTFFCRNDDGGLGSDFWETVMLYVNQMDHALGQWVMRSLGIDPGDYFPQIDAYFDDKRILDTDELGWPEFFLKETWGDWYGKEIEFFKEAGLLISKNQRDLMRIASSVVIKEARMFDHAVENSLEDSLRQEMDTSDQNPGEQVGLEEIYLQMMARYQDMVDARS